MIKLFNKLFLNDEFILFVILVNSYIIYAQVAGYSALIINIVDVLCTIIFIIEMLVKHIKLGIREYWKDGWNKMDGILVILSIPSVMALFVPTEIVNLSVMLIFRLIRVLRFFRVLHFFPNFSKIIKSFRLALRDSYAILLSFFVLIIILGLFNCSLFKEADPEHFQTPLLSIYSMFQICTVEGWYDIPNTLAEYYGASTIMAIFIRMYFCILLLLGGVIGMSFINSIFVDAMAADNNDEVLNKLEILQQSLDKLKDQIESKKDI